MNKRLLRDMDFIVELDKMKSTLRMTNLIKSDEREDDAQHSWHISVMAMVLEEYADKDIDISKVIKMLLIHDVVEIYAGDTFAYDTEGYKDKLDRETRSADKIFGILESDKAEEFKNLWKEFEEVKTKEALFATAMDRLQPILNNFYNDGGTWVKYKVSKDQVLKRIAPIEKISKDLYEYSLSLLDEAEKLSYLS